VNKGEQKGKKDMLRQWTNGIEGEKGYGKTVNKGEWKKKKDLLRKLKKENKGKNMVRQWTKGNERSKKGYGIAVNKEEKGYGKAGSKGEWKGKNIW
jgi:hypothetical protein